MTFHKDSIPASASVEVSLESLRPGLLGYCDAVHALFAEQGHDADLDELAVISGAALQHYIYEPEYNGHEDVSRSHSPLALLFNNFGFFESLRFFTGWEVRDFDTISRDDLWKLATWELSQGRALFTVDTASDLQPALIVGYEGEGTKRVLHVRRRRGDDLLDDVVDLVEVDALQTDPSFQNFLAMVRPSDGGPKALAGPNRQRFALLRWVVEHHERDKEFFHETRENYAPGDRGWQRLLQMVDAPSDADAAYLADHVEMLASGREAASRTLARWGEILGELRESSELRELLAKAGEEFGRVAAAMREGDPEEARREEAKAVATLRASQAWYPGPFEPLD